MLRTMLGGARESSRNEVLSEAACVALEGASARLKELNHPSSVSLLGKVATLLSARILESVGQCTVCDAASIATLRLVVERAAALTAGMVFVYPGTFGEAHLAVNRGRECLDALSSIAARRGALGVGGIRFPEDLCCPLTLCKMVEPVTASDGHTYERTAIEHVIQRGDGKSPLTREMLRPVLYPAHTVLKRIRDYDDELLRVAEAAEAKGRMEGKAEASEEGEARSSEGVLPVVATVSPDAKTPCKRSTAGGEKKQMTAARASPATNRNKRARVH